jgi:hypothetical protein
MRVAAASPPTLAVGLRDRAERTALRGDAVENLVDRGDELVDSLTL